MSCDPLRLLCWSGHHREWPHHVIVFMLKDVAVVNVSLRRKYPGLALTVSLNPLSVGSGGSIGPVANGVDRCCRGRPSGRHRRPDRRRR